MQYRSEFITTIVLSIYFFIIYDMSSKVDVMLLQAVKWLWQKNDIVAVSIAYAKNVLFPKWQAKMADALAKNNLAQKKEQQKKHDQQVAELWDNLHLYSSAKEELIIKRKVTPSGWLYEKVHETDVKQALSQWNIIVPQDIVFKKQIWDGVGPQHAEVTWNGKKLAIPFTIKESLY